MPTNKIAIRVSHLGKKYQIGGPQESYSTLRDTIVHSLKSSLSLLQPAPPIDGFWALKDISFDIEPGEVVGIIGRNGAGKSTLLKILSRITTPSEGVVELHGRVGSLLEVGTGFHPELTGRENIFLSGSILGMKKKEIETKFDEIVKFSEIERFIDTPVKRYSSGMYVRLAFAVAAHLEPEILLVDEVLAVGDAGFQKKCLGKMGDVAHEGRTVLFVSHNMNAVEQLCKSCIHIEGGRIRNMGTDVRSIISSYLFDPTVEGTNAEWLNTRNEYGNPWFNPLRLSITDIDGKRIRNPVSNKDDFFVTIEGVVEEIDTALTIGYAIYDEEGRVLYWSYQTDGPEESWKHFKIGRNTMSSKIPKHLFNEGHYRIELIGGLHFRKWFFEPGNCSFGLLRDPRGVKRLTLLDGKEARDSCTDNGMGDTMIRELMNSVMEHSPNMYRKISYSQCGEDIIVDFVLNSLNVEHPTFLDIGAHHPVFLNNTYLFYRKNIHGICIEPDPDSFARIRRARPRDICLNVGIGTDNRELADFFILSSRSLNTFSKETADAYVNEGNQKIEHVIKVPLFTVHDIITKYLKTTPTFVSLDAEGYDLEIIRNFNFGRFRPEIFCIETLSYSSKNQEVKNTEILQLMEREGYLNYADTYINTIFVDKDKWTSRIV